MLKTLLAVAVIAVLGSSYWASPTRVSRESASRPTSVAGVQVSSLSSCNWPTAVFSSNRIEVRI